MNDYEISKLRKELQRKQDQLKEEREDHQHTQQRLVQLQAERDRFYSELLINRQTIDKVETLMAQKMKEVKSKLQQQNADSLRELQGLRDKLVEQRLLRQRMAEEGKNKDTVVSELSLRLREMSRKYKDPSLLVNVKEVADQAAVTNNNFYKLTEKYNRTCSDLENVLAENKILRKLHGVPQNFGFDLEQIKIAEKQELEDYKAQCRKLESEIEELEEERTQLRYRLRQFSTLYSGKGDRYRDMTAQQLDLLDQYALNLKEGRVQLPQIDKTTKQMERQVIKLKGQIQILQNKTPSLPMNSKPSTEQSDRISLDLFRKMEDQISKLIAPLREDMSKISEGGRVQSQQREGVVVMEGPQFRPPMPLPISHNDWSQIKEGFSYMYNSKIPIDMKGVQDQGVLNMARTRYELAALQLQNIESLKLLKQKQTVEDKLLKEVADLKDKYVRCLRVQDKLFLQHFKEKDEKESRLHQLQVEKNTLIAQKAALEATNDTLTTSFKALSTHTEVEKRCSQLTSRLALSEAEFMKTSRICAVLKEEHLLLRRSYSELEGKWAERECTLKEKLAYAKKSEKEMCFFANKILEEGRDSVSREVHSAVVSKLQTLTDKGMSTALRENELRLKINQMENIDRELHLKDDVIQNLRDDNFDTLLELEIAKSRLQATDADYRAFQDVFRRLVSFINHHNVSLMTYFKKFDKDGSGQLSKDEFISAIRALGFDVSNNQFDLLFNEFDLDGSHSVTYRQFLRKMRRSGVLTRNKEEEGLFRLFKAIKQANISVRKAFQMIDVDGSNEVTKPEMESAFRKLGIDISASTIDYIFKLCDDDMSGSISCGEFQKLFDSLIRESIIEEKEIFTPQLDWKLSFVIKMEEVSEKYHQGGLKQIFNSLDTDGSQAITLPELNDFFKKVGIEIPRKESLELFEFLDRHRDGKVEYFQFLKILEEARQQKKRVDRMRYIKARTEELRRESRENQVGEKSMASEEKTLNVRLLSMESKHGSLLKKNEKLIKSLAAKEQELNELKKEAQELEKNVDQIRSEYYKEKESTIRLQDQLGTRISTQESRTLNQKQRALEVQSEQTGNDLVLYKQLYQDLSTKNRYEEMRLGKIQSEVEKYYEIVKELQGESDSNAQLAKKVYELELSKRNEELTNKKYEQAIEEVRVLQVENRRATDEAAEKEREIIKTHMFLQDKTNLLQSNIDQLQLQILPTLNPHKVNDILHKIRDIAQSKTQLEKEHKQLQEVNFNLQVRNDYLQHQKAAIEELELKLRRNYTDEASLTIMDLTKKLTDYRMNELRAKRESSLLKEKQQYYLRVSHAQTQNVKQLQTELANWDLKFGQREQFWKKRIAEQMKLMQDLQKEVHSSKQEQRNAQAFFREEVKHQQAVEDKFDSLPSEKQQRLAPFVSRRDPQSDSASLQLKATVQELRNELADKEKELYQLKMSFKELVPEAKLADFAGQMSASTTNFLMQTELTTSQLRNNARRFISNQKDQEQYFKDEALKLNQAAQQSIDTLQRIIDDKNQQLRRKDHLIESLRKEFLKAKEEDSNEIQVLHQQLRQLRTKAQVGTVNELMSRPTSKNFYGGGRSEQTVQLRAQLARKEEEHRLLLDKYDRLFISKDKKSHEQTAAGQRILERKMEEVQAGREAERQKYIQNEQRLTLKIKNLEKLSKEKDIKLAKLQKTLIDLKNMAISQASKPESNEVEEQLKEAILGLTKGKTPNDSKMEVTMQKSLQMVQELSKRNRDLEGELRRMREDKMGKTAFKK